MAALAVHVPAGAGPVNTSHPAHVVGNGTAHSCTSAAVVAAVRAGGIIRFSCGPKPVTITMGSYGVGVSRAVAAIAEQTYDEKGLCWPRKLVKRITLRKIRSPLGSRRASRVNLATVRALAG